MILSFLVFVDRSAHITQVRWSSASDCLRRGEFLPDCLNIDATKLLAILAQLDGPSHCEDMLTQTIIAKQEYSVMLHICLISQRYIVFGIALEPLMVNNELAAAYTTLVNAIIEEFYRDRADTTISVNKQFEQIQALNNELTNAQRMLAKANYQLSISNEQLQVRLSKDALTGLVSRYSFYSDIEAKLRADPGSYGVFTFIDLDDFKSVNDHYGHGVGDQFLIEFANRLRSLPLENTLKIRIAGDEFALFTYNLTREPDQFCRELVRLVKEAVLQPAIVIGDVSISVSASLGIAIYGVDTDSIDKMIQYADFAMYQAKAQGKNRCCRFDRETYDNVR